MGLVSALNSDEPILRTRHTFSYRSSNFSHQAGVLVATFDFYQNTAGQKYESKAVPSSSQILISHSSISQYAGQFPNFHGEVLNQVSNEILLPQNLACPFCL